MMDNENRLPFEKAFALAMHVVDSFRLYDFRQLDLIGVNKTRCETQIVNEDILSVLNSPSMHSSLLTKHGVFAVLKHKNRSASFFVNRIHELQNIESLAWYLFEFKDIRFMRKKISISAKKYFSNIFNPHVFTINIPIIYFVWKVYFRKENVTFTSEKDWMISYQKDRLNFLRDCYNSGIDETEFYGNFKKNSLEISEVNISYLGQFELNSRASVYKNNSPDTLIALFFDLAVHFPNSVEKLYSLGRSLIDFLSVKVLINNKFCSLFALVAYLSFTLSKDRAYKFDWQCTDIDSWFLSEWCSAFPASRVVNQINSEPKTINNSTLAISANWDGNSGLTRNALMSFAAATNCGANVEKIDAYGYLSNDKNVLTNARKILVHYNADDCVDTILNIESNPLNNINREYYGFYLWELEDIPPIHELGAAIVNKILTPTSFLKDAYSRVNDVNNVQNIGKYILMQKEAKLTDEFELVLQNNYCFLTVFDAGSGIDRKNPYALVKAYCEEFKQNEGSFLILKGGRPSYDHWGDPYETYGKILKLIEGRSDIILIENYISDEDVQALISKSSCIVSPHRGEGFGYLMAYALLKGKPLIYCPFTGFDSEFFKAKNCYSLEYKLQKLPFGKFFHDGYSAVWANVSLPDLKSKLRYAFENKIQSANCDPEVSEYFSIEKYGGRLLTAVGLA